MMDSQRQSSLPQLCLSRWDDTPLPAKLQEQHALIHLIPHRRGRRRTHPGALPRSYSAIETRSAPRRKSVSFEPFVQVKKVTSIANAEDLRTLWYTREDYLEIEAENRATRKLLRGGYPERLDFCFRGLEYKTKTNGRLRNERVLETWDLVEVAENECRSTEELALLYAAHCHSDRIEAYQRGLFDAKDAKGIPCFQSGVDAKPRKPRRTWARAC